MCMCLQKVAKHCRLSRCMAKLFLWGVARKKQLFLQMSKRLVYVWMQFPQTKAQLTSRDLQFERLSITQQTHFKALLLGNTYVVWKMESFVSITISDGSSTLVYLSLVHVTSPSKQDLSGRNWGELFPNLRHVKFGYKGTYEIPLP